MHSVVSRIALSVTGTALLAGALVAAGPASAAPADTAPQRPSKPDVVAAGGFTPLTPARVLDTRPSSALAPSGLRTLKVTGMGGVPGSGVAAVVLNLTAVTPQASGYLSAFPGPSQPTVSNLNFSAGRTIANLAVVPVDQATGTIQLFNGSGGRTDVLADVTGWFAPSGTTPATDGGFKPVGPTRLLDTRDSTAVPAGGTRKLVVRGSVVPALAGAAVLNVTAVTAGAAGYLSVYPGTTRPTSSNVNFATGQTVAGAAAVRLDTDGSVTIFNASAKPLQVTVDVAGWFRGAIARDPAMFTLLSPARIADTRNGTGTARAPIAAGTARAITVTGRGGIPTTGVAAVVLTITATTTTASGYLTVYPGGTRPTASTLNFNAGQTVPNLVVVPVQSGAITVFNGSGRSVDVLADVAGFVRSNALTGSVSHYIRSLTATQSTASITTQLGQLGVTDGQAASSTAQVVLLQFGAQSAKAGGDGSGTGSLKGVRLTATDMRITYDQVVTAVNAYVDGYVEGRGGDTSPVTIAVGTSTAGFAGATYTPAAKAQDWWNSVVAPTVAHANGTGITIAGATDIEANFDAKIAEVKTWVTTYLATAPAANFLVNNGAAAGCPTTIGQLGACSPVPIEETKPVQTQAFSLTDLYAVSGGLRPTRIQVLPQIYSGLLANQWENVNLAGIAAGGSPLTFTGVLSSYAACSTPSSGCTSVDPNSALQLMNAALDARSSTASTVLPAVSDLTVS